MGILKKISSFFSAPAVQESNALYVYVQCNRCGEKLRGRVDLRNDLSPEYENSDVPSAYYCRKVLIGEQRCFQSIEMVLKFDGRHRLVDKTITGGKFITEEEYAAGQA
jgi:hypothetical protein